MNERMRAPAGQELPPPAEAERGAPRGQILVMFAMFLTAMVGVLGLAVDLGMAFAERRTMQNAADLAAIAGAHAIARNSSDDPQVARTPVEEVVAGNRLGSVGEIEECAYLSQSGESLGDCGAAVPSAARGVRVRVRETHNTFFIRVVPGAPRQVTTGATATAMIERLTALGGSNGPFIVCGYETKVEGGGRLSILSNNSTVNPNAFGKTFQVHGPQIADCGMASSSFKGLAEQDSNVGKSTGEYWYGETGVRAGPTRVRVRGIEGCDQGAAAPYNCVMLLPVATDNPEARKVGSDRLLYVVKILAFRVSSCGANCHQGELIRNYVATGPSSPGWTPNSGDIAVVRLKS